MEPVLNVKPAVGSDLPSLRRGGRCTRSERRENRERGHCDYTRSPCRMSESGW